MLSISYFIIPDSSQFLVFSHSRRHSVQPPTLWSEWRRTSNPNPSYTTTEEGVQRLPPPFPVSPLLCLLPFIHDCFRSVAFLASTSAQHHLPMSVAVVGLIKFISESFISHDTRPPWHTKTDSTREKLSKTLVACRFRWVEWSCRLSPVARRSSPVAFGGWTA